MKRNEHKLFEGIPHWIIKGGVSSVLIAAMIAAAFGALWLFNYIAPVSIPFLLAFVFGIITFPLVRFGDRYNIPRKVSALIVVLLVFVILWAAVQITIVGVISEAGNIGNELVRSVQTIGIQIGDSLDAAGISQQQIDEIVFNITGSIRNTVQPSANNSATSDMLQSVMSGIGSLRTAVSSVFNIFFGLFIGAMLLYYLLSDYETIEQWMGTHLGVDPLLGVGMVEDATSSMRDYFKGITIKGIATAIGTMVVLFVLGVPLAIPIAIVTFITGYIPFVGAWIAVSFAVLVAFGAKGLTIAAIVLVACLVINNLLEQIVYNRVVGDELNMHPIVVMGTTILGLTVAGLLGATFATPLAAMVLRIYDRLKLARELEEAGEELLVSEGMECLQEESIDQSNAISDAGILE